MSFFKKDKTSSPPKKIKRYDKEPTEFERGLADLREEYSIKGIIIAIAITFLISVILSGFLIENAKYNLHMQEYILVSDIFKTGAFSLLGTPITIILTLAILKFIFWMMRRFKKTYHTERTKNYQVNDRHDYGSADYQDEYEINRCFYRAKDPLQIPNNLDILGEGIEDHMLYAVRDDLVSMNGHKVVIGSSGAGKSATLVKNLIYQTILRGESIVVTDSKGDLYADTAKLAKKKGYTVRILNLKTNELKNSDGCDFLKMLADDDIKAGVLAETIIKNTEDGERLDYWAKNELNYVKALLLYVSTNQALKKAGRATLAEVFNLTSSKSLDEVHEMFGLLDPEHPAMAPYHIFAQAEPKIQAQIVNGLGIRLQVLANKWAKRVVSADEIDLIAPMKKKCIYFVTISDTETTFKFLATLFFSELFIELCNYFDYQSQKCRKTGTPVPCLPVNFILDEYANTGAIPEMDVKIATVRSRQIGITIILQDKGQLDEMYGDNLSNSILNNMSIKILLKTTDMKTAKYFSDLLGVQTIRVENRGYQENVTDVFHTKGEYKVSEGSGKRNLENPDELINSLDNNHMIVHIAGFHPIKLKKFLHSRHPMAKECEPLVPGEHIPKWRREMHKKEIEAEKAKAEAEAGQEDETEENNASDKSKSKPPAKNIKLTEHSEDNKADKPKTGSKPKTETEDRKSSNDKEDKPAKGKKNSKKENTVVTRKGRHVFGDMFPED